MRSPSAREERPRRRSPGTARQVDDGSLGPMTEGTPAFDARTIERPDPTLWTYYIILSVLTVVFLPITLVGLYLRYSTLRYRFDDEGIAMSVGFLFKREVHLTYRRIQDIHVTRGFIQRYLGLATISLQTAAGSASAEMQIEGVLQADQLRDWLYARMRGAPVDDAVVVRTVPIGALPGAAGAVRSATGAAASSDAASSPGEIGSASAAGSGPVHQSGEATAVLTEILHEVRTLRERLESRR